MTIRGINLISIESGVSIDGRYSFMAIVEGSPGRMNVGISAEELLDYPTTRRVLLERTGQVYLYTPAEAVPPEVGGALWRKHVATLLTRPGDDETDDPGSAPPTQLN